MNTHNPKDFRPKDFRPSDFRPNDFRDRVRRSDDNSARFDRIPLTVRTLSSNTLFQGEHEIGIEHHGALYRLKITRQGKLILNK
ncbi:hemin uptake protein HemP [Mesorhizobium sp.]|uniref:hemin uptake protein HemP n=1 Tax=Mesorhizobium sp. TaxID=1871066 RepID=UPI000FE5188C|nr:hemin uptake protein HemP [Mesorhizobium sp.]RWK62453.1 MAG: hemin uptake protein HemP [Mesorhizobium sp.]RWM43822.1 MAG: hemin uptake protein HemP [Mesorhizobium sp.]RWM57832.1 MAG: hemin uptake protein HemP [Mesorhizobium sp.]RWM59182.1 MAG: hemin uptake protein HemP [Mesorhizobium sp.]RWM97614.1 MAG: hemin uptake protein HemP [Mesorhizobium sp.]